MLKKKDPYIALLNFYYERFPEYITLPEVYDLFHQQGYITAEELEIMKAFGKERQRKDPKIEEAAERKRRSFEVMFMRAGESMSSMAGRNAPHIMNSTHYFYRLEYIKIIEARQSSRFAFLMSLLAILISLASLYMSWDSSQKPIKISDYQIKQITDSLSGNEEITNK